MPRPKKLHGIDDCFGDQTLCGRPAYRHGETGGYGFVPYYEMTCRNCIRVAAARKLPAYDPLPNAQIGTEYIPDEEMRRVPRHPGPLNVDWEGAKARFTKPTPPPNELVPFTPHWDGAVMAAILVAAVLMAFGIWR